MAQFRATIKGSRGEASRLGTKSSGMVATVNGWDGGVRVEAMHNQDNEDIFYIYATGGSNGNNGLNTGLIGIVDMNGEFISAKDYYKD